MMVCESYSNHNYWGGWTKEPMTSLCRIDVFCVGKIITKI